MWSLLTMRALYVYRGHHSKVNSILCVGEFLFSSSYDRFALFASQIPPFRFVTSQKQHTPAAAAVTLPTQNMNCITFFLFCILDLHRTAMAWRICPPDVESYEGRERSGVLSEKIDLRSDRDPLHVSTFTVNPESNDLFVIALSCHPIRAPSFCRGTKKAFIHWRSSQQMTIRTAVCANWEKWTSSSQALRTVLHVSGPLRQHIHATF